MATINDVRLFQEHGQAVAVTAGEAHGRTIDELHCERGLATGPHPRLLGGDGRTDGLFLVNRFSFSTARPIQSAALPVSGNFAYGGSATAHCFCRVGKLYATAKEEEVDMASILHLAAGVGGPSTRGAVDSLLRDVSSFYMHRQIGVFTKLSAWWIEQYANELGVVLQEMDSTGITLGAMA